MSLPREVSRADCDKLYHASTTFQGAPQRLDVETSLTYLTHFITCIVPPRIMSTMPVISLIIMCVDGFHLQYFFSLLLMRKYHPTSLTMNISELNAPIMYPYLIPDNIDDEQPKLRRCLIVKYR